LAFVLGCGTWLSLIEEQVYYGGCFLIGLHIRDERQMKALTGLSQAQCDSLLPVFRDLYRATQQQTYEEGLQSGTRRRRPGGGAKGKLPTIVEK
jgi:hypothetical protein